jgi:predicted nuclease of predicted toxin-antitoxin system
VKFLIDAQLPRRLAYFLAEAGHDAIHTLDLPEANRTSDGAVTRRADADDRVVVTKDADFVVSHTRDGQPKRMLLVATGNITNRDLLALFARHLPAITALLEDVAFVQMESQRLIARG